MRKKLFSLFLCSMMIFHTGIPLSAGVSDTEYGTIVQDESLSDEEIISLTGNSPEAAVESDFETEEDVVPATDTGLPMLPDDETEVTDYEEIIADDDVTDDGDSSDIDVALEDTDASLGTLPDVTTAEEALVGATVGLNVASHTQSQIKSYVKNSGLSLYADSEFARMPVDELGAYDPGLLSNATMQNALGVLNLVRYIAGLNDNVTLNSSYTELVQAGAFVNSLNGVLSHYPERPDGISDELYEKAQRGCSSANIAMGYSNLGKTIVAGWMGDYTSASNLSTVGHRRWIINPTMSQTGFGQINSYSAMYSFDRNGSGSETNVAWPAQNMPIEFFGDVYPWSISTGQSEDASKVRVTLKKESGNATWTFANDSTDDGLFYVNNDGYGMKGCIIFRPNDITYEPGDVFQVTITGAKAGTIQYTVSFFELYPIESVAMSDTELTLEINESERLRAEPVPAESRTDDFVWSSSNTNVCTVSQYGYVWTVSAGQAVITAEAGGKKGTCTINVRPKPTSTPKPSKTPTPKPTATATPKPTATPTPKPTATATPKPTATPTPKPTATATPKPTSTPRPSKTPTPKPTATATPKPTATPLPKQNIRSASISGISLSYGYTGEIRTPAFTVKLKGVELKAGTDYTYEFENNLNPGTAVLTLTGIGNYTGTKERTFEIVDCVSTLVSGRTYQLIPKNNSSTAVCAFSGRTVNNTKVYITDRSNSEAMKFKAIKNSDGTWKFINSKCELALAVQQNSSALGAGTVLYDQTTKKAQNWKLERKGDNSFAIMNAVTGYSIAMSDESAVKGTTLSMAETQSNGLQRFYIADTTAVNAPFNGTYTVRASANKNYGLNIASSSKEDGANVILYSCSSTNAGKFKVLYSGGGYYRIANVNSGLVLTVAGNTKKDGANVIQSKWAELSGQKWKITKNANGTVTFTNYLGTVLHLVSNKAANGTNIVAKTPGTSGAQKWYLNK